MDRVSRSFGRLLDFLMLLACALLLTMTLLIGADVGLRNVGLGGIAWSNEVCEYILYLVTLLSAPWLLRRGQHIRVDILLRTVPPLLGWMLEWVGDPDLGPPILSGNYFSFERLRIQRSRASQVRRQPPPSRKAGIWPRSARR